MNKKEFVKEIATLSNISQTKCEQILNNCYKLIHDSLIVGESINIKGFGKFFVKTKKERIVKNIQTKEFSMLEQKKVVCFKISSTLKYIVK